VVEPEPPAAASLQSDEPPAPDAPSEQAIPEIPAAEATDPAPTASPDLQDEVPEPAAGESRHPGPRTAGVRTTHRRSVVAIAVLSLVLVLQLLLADRAQLAASAQWRPLLTLLCEGLRCTLPPWHEPAAFTVIARDVTPDPRRPGVLHVTASVRNDARWPQALPKLWLTLSDADGRVAGERVFVPSEYQGRAATKKELASGQRIAIRLDVIEPAPHIVAFTFDFR